MTAKAVANCLVVDASAPGCLCLCEKFSLGTKPRISGATMPCPRYIREQQPLITEIGRPGLFLVEEALSEPRQLSPTSPPAPALGETPACNHAK